MKRGIIKIVGMLIVGASTIGCATEYQTFTRKCVITNVLPVGDSGYYISVKPTGQLYPVGKEFVGKAKDSFYVFVNKCVRRKK